MKNIDFKAIFAKQWPHLVIIGLFFVITYIFFAPQFGGNALRQSDVEQFKGMAHEIQEYRETHGEEPLWTNSMFGGMPAYQISVKYHDNWAIKMVEFFRMGLNAPAGLFIVYLLGFYIMLMCMKINPWIALFGAVAFALSSYFIIIIEVGHNSKAAAIGLMPPVIGAFWMAFRGNLKWGVILSALFMSIQVAANHLQVTYYLGIILLFLGLAEVARSAGVKESPKKEKLIFGGYLLISFLLMFVLNNSTTFIFVKIAVIVLTFLVVGLYRAYKKGRLKRLLVSVFALFIVYGFSLVINYGNLSLTTDYAAYTIRGGNDLKLAPDGTLNDLNSTEGGLDRDYVTRWSLGLDESLTLVSPDVKGGGSVGFDSGPYKTMFEDSEMRQYRAATSGYPSYWGEQPGTSGPVYIGALIFLLMVLGMIYIKDPSKWALLFVSILALALAWGKNYMGLTDFFLDYVPGYDKFRAITIILVIVELCLPLIAVLYLQKLIKEREEIKKNILPFIIGSGAVIVFFFAMLIKGDSSGYISNQVDLAQLENIESGVRNQISQMTPEQLNQYGINPNDEAMIQNIIAEQSKSVNDRLDKVVEVREMIYSSSITRSLWIVFFGAAFILLFVYVSSIPKEVLLGALTLILLVDLGVVAKQYLNGDKIETSEELQYYKQVHRDNTLKKGDYIQWASRFDQFYPLKPNKADMDVFKLETEQNPELRNKIENAVKNIESADPDKNTSRRRGAESSLDNQEIAKQFAVLNANTNYRVFEPQGGVNSSRASYFHKSLGGYHGAKLRRIQNIIEYHLAVSNNKIFDMLNVKYILNPQGAQINPTAAGNAWFVKELSVKETPDDEIRGLGKEFTLKNLSGGQLLVNGEPKSDVKVYGRENLQYVVGKDTVRMPLSNGLPVGMEVVFVQDVNGRANLLPKTELEKDSLNSFTSLVGISVTDDFFVQDEAIVSPGVAKEVGAKKFTGIGSIEMTSYAPNALSYDVNTTTDQFAVFSEIYYPKGWNAYIDGKPAELQRVNYTLRGLKIPAGAKKVEMKFEVSKFNNANLISLICSIILFGLVIFMFVKDFLLKNDKENELIKDNIE